MKTIAAVAASVCLFQATIVAAQNCDAYAPYLWQYSTAKVTTSSTRSFAHYLCESDARLTSSTGSTSVGIGIPGVASFDFGSRYGDSASVKHAFCDFENQSSDFQQAVATFEKSASPVVAHLIETCFNTKGLHVAAFQGASPEHLRLQFGFTSPSPKIVSTSVRLSFLPSGSLTCEAVRFSVDSAGKVVLCQRRRDDAVTIAVNADYFPDHPAFDVPQIRHLPPLTVITLDRNTPDTCCELGNKFDGYRSAYMKRDPAVDGMWTATGGGPYHVGWIVDAPVAGTYTLLVEYASADSRPTEVHLENSVQTDMNRVLFVGLNEPTGGATVAKWSIERSVELVKGVNRLWLHREQPPPNINAIKLIKQPD